MTLSEIRKINIGTTEKPAYEFTTRVEMGKETVELKFDHQPDLEEVVNRAKTHRGCNESQVL